jgi:V/A-type H+-transporting ATPase subunit I
MLWCGFSSVAAGLLFGSFFGFSLFKPLWFSFHDAVSGHSGPGGRDVYSILKITIMFGIAVIYTGIVLNIINCIAKRRWLKLFFDKGGLLGAFIYGAGVYTAFYFAESGYKAFPPADFLALCFGLPVLLLIIKPVAEHITHSRTHPGVKTDFFTIINIFMEWLVELLELASGYLANTLSFMRVAGLGIAHVSLMTAFYQIALLAGKDGRLGAGSVIILILGNFLVIALEGLSAGIQSLRLNYYEFFSKYFSGNGRAYEPVSLRTGKQQN